MRPRPRAPAHAPRTSQSKMVTTGCASLLKRRWWAGGARVWARPGRGRWGQPLTMHAAKPFFFTHTVFFPREIIKKMM